MVKITIILTGEHTDNFREGVEGYLGVSGGCLVGCLRDVEGMLKECLDSGGVGGYLGVSWGRLGDV